jgi:hypothetical protein
MLLVWSTSAAVEVDVAVAVAVWRRCLATAGVQAWVVGKDAVSECACRATTDARSLDVRPGRVCDDKADVPQVAGRLAPPCGMPSRCTPRHEQNRRLVAVECGSWGMHRRVRCSLERTGQVSVHRRSRAVCCLLRGGALSCAAAAALA